MLFWTIQVTIISIILIFLVHHLLVFFRNNLTTPNTSADIAAVTAITGHVTAITAAASASIGGICANSAGRAIAI